MRSLLLLLAACAPPDGTLAPDDTDTALPEAAPAPLGLPSTCDEGEVWCNQAAVVGLEDLGPRYGRGAAWVDVDGDGWEDLWVSDGASTYGGAVPSTLYRNRGDGTFVPMDPGIAPDHLRNNWSGVWGDIDGDGDPDLLLVDGGYHAREYLHLYRNDLNDAGTFTDISEAAGILPKRAGWWGAAFADHDGDGDLDFVAVSLNRVMYAGELWEGAVDLYRNRGDGTFEEVSDAVGLLDPVGDAHDPVWIDADRDGDPDLYVANVGILEGSHHDFYRNDGGTFTPVTDTVFPADCDAPVFSAATADFDQDGWPDIYLGRAHDQDLLALNQGDGTFACHGRDVGLDMLFDPDNIPTDPQENAMGLGVGDIDDDGFPDVLVGTGRPEAPGLPLVYCNVDGERFERCSTPFEAGHGLAWHHGTLVGDVDHDGDSDILWNLGGAPMWDILAGTESAELPALYVQHPAEPPATATVHLVGSRANTEALGAHLTVHGDRDRHYDLWGAQGFQSDNGRWLTVVLGGVEATVTVDWPGGGRSEHLVRCGERVTLTQP